MGAVVPEGRVVRDEHDQAAIDHDVLWHGDVYVEYETPPEVDDTRRGLEWWRTQRSPS